MTTFEFQEKEGDPGEYDRLEGESEDEELEAALNILKDDDQEEDDMDMGQCDDAPMPRQERRTMLLMLWLPRSLQMTRKNASPQPPAAAAAAPEVPCLMTWLLGPWSFSTNMLWF